MVQQQAIAQRGKDPNRLCCSTRPQVYVARRQGRQMFPGLTLSAPQLLCFQKAGRRGAQGGLGSGLCLSFHIPPSGFPLRTDGRHAAAGLLRRPFHCVQIAAAEADGRPAGRVRVHVCVFLAAANSKGANIKETGDALDSAPLYSFSLFN